MVNIEISCQHFNHLFSEYSPGGSRKRVRAARGAAMSVHAASNQRREARPSLANQRRVLTLVANQRACYLATRRSEKKPPATTPGAGLNILQKKNVKF